MFRCHVSTLAFFQSYKRAARSAAAAKAAQERLREKLREIKLNPLPCNHEVVKPFEWMATHDERENLQNESRRFAKILAGEDD